MLASLQNWWDRTVWQADIGSLPGWKRKSLLFLRGLQMLVDDLLAGSNTLHAMGLVYMSILSLVPLFAVMFSVLKGFGVHNQLQPLLLKGLAPLGEKGVEITDTILGFVDNIRVGVLGAIGLGILLFTVVSLIRQVEVAFNSTWRVRRLRPILERISHYISVLLIGPVLIFSAIGLSQSVEYMNLFQQVVETDMGAFFYNTLSIYLPFFMTVIAIAFIYMFVPNTRVRPAAALFGATISTLLFKAASSVFTLFILGSTRFEAIYSAFATAILLFIWIFIIWLILLLGSSIAYYYQYADRLLFLYRDEELSPFEGEVLALQLMVLVAKNYYAELPLLSLSQIAQQLQLPDDMVEKMIYRLEKGGYLEIVDENEKRLLPGRPPEETSCAELLAYVRDSRMERNNRANLVSSDNVIAVLKQAEQEAYTVTKDITIKQLASDE